MDFLQDVVDQGRRAATELMSWGGIERDAPTSADVPEHLQLQMPHLDRFPMVFPWEKPKPVDPALHNVWIMDNTAFRSPQDGDNRANLEELKDKNVAKPTTRDSSGHMSQPADRGSGWEVEIVACYFVKNSGRDQAKIVAEIAHQLNIRDDDVASRKRIAARLQPFVDTVLPNRTLRIAIEGKEEQSLGPSSYSGISSGLYELHFDPRVPSTLQSIPVNLPPPFSLPGSTVVADETGWGVISDIDDTIKVTMTPSLLGILQSTFVVETPEPIAGMPELYAHMSSILQTPPFFYLSASPYNLYPFLKTFRETHYPPGTIILRDASWQNLGGLIASMQQNTDNYKISRMQKINSWFPHRRFICLGDSTQSDPEAYGEVARTYPGWVRAVFIRKVTGIAEMDETAKNAPERFEKAFRGLDRGLWHVFTDPGELAERVEELVRDPEALVGGE